MLLEDFLPLFVAFFDGARCGFERFFLVFSFNQARIALSVERVCCAVQWRGAFLGSWTLVWLRGLDIDRSFT